MAKYTVVTMPGDGIGNVVLAEALRLLDAVGFDAEYVHADVGWEFWKSEGNALPERTVEDPALQGQGLVYYSPIVSMRQLFSLDVCIRPCRSFPGNPLNFIRRTSDGGFEEPQVDAVIFRQNTEGLYAGIEWTNPPAQVLEALGTHPRFERFAAAAPEDLAISTRVFTRHACRRILRAAFEYAEKHGYESVTVCEKPNVLRETSGMLEHDAQMMWLTKNPEAYGVIVAGNMFGDIVSDAFAGLVGGLGFAASGNIGDEVAVFEPTHGSAPKYEHLDPPIVNPIAMFLTSAMLLDHVGEMDMARAVRGAVAEVIEAGEVRVYDMMKLPGGPDVIQQGAATTIEMTDAVISKLPVAAGV
jgi:3-isopropylmalate dehydrogenase